MKKIVLMCLCFVLIVTLSACNLPFAGNSTGQKAYEEAKLSLAAGNYDEALRYLKLAKDEGTKAEDIDETIDVIDKFLKAKELFDAGKNAEALGAVNSVPVIYNDMTIKNVVDTLKSDIQRSIDEIEKIDIQIENTERLFAAGDYEGCSINISDILANPAITSEQKNKVETISQQLTTAQNKINAEKNKAPQTVYVNSQTSATNSADYNGASAAVRNFVYAYVAFVMNGDRTSDSYYSYMSAYSPSWSNAYTTQWNYFVKHSITSYNINSLTIKSVSQSGNTFYVTDTESIGETKDGKFINSTSTWVYTVQKNNGTYVVTNYRSAK